MAEFFLASGLIFLVLVAWLYVQEVYRRFARRHPELGPFRREGACDGGCGCSQESCPTAEHGAPRRPVVVVDQGTSAIGRSIQLRGKRQ